MYRIILTLINIRFRKIFSKQDQIAILLFFLAYVFLIYCLNYYFSLFRDYSLLLSLDILFFHFSRKDIELLRLSKHYKLILFVEYCIYSVPYLVLLLINQEYLFFLLYLVLIAIYGVIPQVRSRVMSYPFKLFDPFWHIGFRRYYLILIVLLSIFFTIMGFEYNNDNLSFFAIILTSIVISLPSFQREAIEHIKVSGYRSGEYVSKQLKITAINTVILLLPILFVFLIFQKWDLLVFIPVVFIFPLINVIFKYVFFANLFIHQLVAALFVGTMGVVIILLPFLYYKSIKEIIKIQDASN